MKINWDKVKDSCYIFIITLTIFMSIVFILMLMGVSFKKHTPIMTLAYIATFKLTEHIIKKRRNKL